MQEDIDIRLTEIERDLDSQQRSIDDLSDMVFRQGKIIDALVKQNEMLKSVLAQDVVKPLSEETPPPHY